MFGMWLKLHQQIKFTALLSCYMEMKTKVIFLFGILTTANVVNCFTIANDGITTCKHMARDHQGQSFEIHCPAGCDAFTNRLWGTTVYTDDSYICAAAIHEGKLTVDGGYVKVWKSGSRSAYSSTTKNGITSKSYGYWRGSFHFTDSPKVELEETVLCTKQANSNNENHFVATCPSGCDSHTSRLWGTIVYTDDSYICAAAIHAGRIEATNGGDVTVWKSNGRSSYSGTSRNGIASKSYGSWGGSFQFTDSRNNQQATSCTTQANNYEENHFTVLCPSGCDSHVSRLWGSVIYTDDSYICAAAIHDGVIEANEGGKVNVWKSDGRSNYIGTSKNAITSKSYGSWTGSFQFTETISCTTQANNYDENHFTVVCPSGCDSHVSRLWGSAIYTDDSYICAAAIHDGVIEANSGGQVNVWKSDGRSNYSGTSTNGITSKSYGSWSGSFQFTEPKVVQVSDTVPCTTQANTYNKNHFTVICPGGCESNTFRLWGNEIYTDDSYICAAAIHNGVIEADEGGKVQVWKMDGRSSYLGTTRNGVTSKSYGAWSGSFKFNDSKSTENETRTDTGGEIVVWKSSGENSYSGATRFGIRSKSYGKWSGSFQFSDPALVQMKDNKQDTIVEDEP